MNGFRAIYRGNPGDKHAAAAVAEVAELFEERGRQLDDAKSLQAAVGQYEYLAKAYPGDRLAAVALEKALRLMGPEDAEEAAKVRAELVQDYPREAKRDGVVAEAAVANTPAFQRRDVGHPEVAGMSGGAGDSRYPTHDDKAVMNGAPGGEVAAHVGDDQAVATMGHPEVVDERSGRVIPEKVAKEKGPLAMVTGIRHWSTASYTRVAIDLNVPAGEEVKYEAARVENPDRIFFDIEHARLAGELTGKSFNVTDDGFLERVRAAQFNDDVTRVVLDVHHVTEYSAFLLPNPYRLIIDIHGASAGAGREEVAAAAPLVVRMRPTLATMKPSRRGGALRGGGFELAADAGDGWECELWAASSEYGPRGGEPACGSAARGDCFEPDGGAAGAEYGGEEFARYEYRGCGC